VINTTASTARKRISQGVVAATLMMGMLIAGTAAPARAATAHYIEDVLPTSGAASEDTLFNPTNASTYFFERVSNLLVIVDENDVVHEVPIPRPLSMALDVRNGDVWVSGDGVAVRVSADLSTSSIAAPRGYLDVNPVSDRLEVVTATGEWHRIPFDGGASQSGSVPDTPTDVRVDPVTGQTFITTTGAGIPSEVRVAPATSNSLGTLPLPGRVGEESMKFNAVTGEMVVSTDGGVTIVHPGLNFTTYAFDNSNVASIDRPFIRADGSAVLVTDVRNAVTTIGPDGSVSTVFVPDPSTVAEDSQGDLIVTSGSGVAITRSDGGTEFLDLGIALRPDLTQAVANLSNNHVLVSDASGAISVVAEASTPEITTPSLPGGTVGSKYETTVTASGDPDIVFSISEGSLPTGLTLDARTGAITGIPTTAGSLAFTVSAANPFGSDTRDYTVTIASVGSPPTITTPDILDGTVGDDYEDAITATSDSPVTFEVTAGGLPSGLQLDSATGLIAGTPTTEGQFQFTVSARNAFGTDIRDYALLISEPAITPPPTPDPSGTPSPITEAGPSTPATGKLAFTGVEIGTWLAIGGALLTAGIAAAVTAYERRRHNN